MKNAVLKIDIVSDVSCPWCIIGYKALNNAIESLSLQGQIEVNWKPFELNPQMPPEGQDISEHLHQKYGATAELSAHNRAGMIARGKEVGFEFSFRDRGRIYNTFDAHRLLYWAQKFNKQTELKLALFDLYFTNGGNPSNKTDLLAAVKQVGLKSDTADKILASNKYAEEVRQEQADARNLGIHSVPTFIINDKYMISGGQPESVFRGFLESIDEL